MHYQPMKPAAKHNTLIPKLILLMGLLLPLYILFLIHRYSANIPFWDAWDSTLPMAQHYFQHQLSLHEVWQAHNLHRIVLTKLIYLFDYLVFAGNRLPLLLFEIVIQLTAWLVLLYQLRKLIQPQQLIYGFVAIAFAMILFAPQMGKIWFWGFVLQQTLTPLFFTLAIFCTRAESQRTPQLFLPILFSLLCTLSSGNGLGIWPTIVALLICNRSSLRNVITYLALGIMVYAIYFYHNASALNAAQVTLSTRIHYFFVFMGSMFSISSKTIALAVGIIAFCYYCFCLSYTLFGKLSNKEKNILLPWLFIGALAIGSAVLGAIARSNGGNITEALTGRYLALVAPFWCGLIVTSIFLYRKHNLQRFIAVKFAIFIIITAGISSYFMDTLIGTIPYKNVQQLLQVSADAVYHGVYIVNPDSGAALLNPNRQEVLRDLDFLRQHHFTVFHNPNATIQIGSNIKQYGFTIDKQTIPGKFRKINTNNTKINTKQYGFTKGLAAYGQINTDHYIGKRIFILDKHGRIYGLGYAFQKPMYSIVSAITSHKLLQHTKVRSGGLNWRYFISHGQAKKIERYLNNGSYIWVGYISARQANQANHPMLQAYLQAPGSSILQRISGTTRS